MFPVSPYFFMTFMAFADASNADETGRATPDISPTTNANFLRIPVVLSIVVQIDLVCHVKHHVRHRHKLEWGCCTAQFFCHDVLEFVVYFYVASPAKQRVNHVCCWHFEEIPSAFNHHGQRAANHALVSHCPLDNVGEQAWRSLMPCFQNAPLTPMKVVVIVPKQLLGDIMQFDSNKTVFIMTSPSVPPTVLLKIPSSALLISLSENPFMNTQIPTRRH